MLQLSPQEQTSTHTFCKTLDIRTPRIKCSMFLGCFQTHWAKLWGLLTTSSGSPQLYYPTAIMLHLGPFLAYLSHIYLQVSMASLAKWSHVPSAYQECKYSALVLLIMDLKSWSYHCFTVKSEMTAGNSKMSKHKTEEKAKRYFITCNFQDLCISWKPKMHANPK